jgi:uncharacterized phiE125 gp8 family phage protein
MLFLHGNFRVLSPPASEPVSLAQAKNHLKVDNQEDDALIASIVSAARQYVEQHCNTAIITQTIAEQFPHFISRGMALSVAPVIEVSAIQYTDDARNENILPTSVYGVNIFTKPGAVFLRYGQTFPTTIPEPDAVTVTYTAGYGDSSGDVPEPIRQAILLMVGDMYQNRENMVKRLPTMAEYLLAPYRFNHF